ncbi:MAG: carboxypeptidase regulatory-like domain-containing protein [Planctomycetes bacterium]|nr:carboxypeptidase regulatory-like domain-containing protein [Planctomycetota bacterium]
MRRLPCILAALALGTGLIAVLAWRSDEDRAPELGASPRPAAPPAAVPTEACPLAETPVIGVHEDRAASERTRKAPDAAVATSAVEIRLEEHGTPLSDLEIRLEGNGTRRAGRTDGDGTFRAELPVGEYRVEIPARGIVTTVRAASVETTTARLELPGTGWLAGRVTDAESGEAIPDALVEIFPEEGPGENPGYTRMGFAQTDARGEFRIESLPADRAVLVEVSRRSHAERREVSTTGREIDVRLSPLGEFEAEVTDARGEPVAARPIEIEIRAPRGAAETYEALLDSKGRLLVTDLAAGNYLVRVRVEGGPWSEEAKIYCSPHRGVPVVLTVETMEVAR